MNCEILNLQGQSFCKHVLVSLFCPKHLCPSQVLLLCCPPIPQVTSHSDQNDQEFQSVNDESKSICLPTDINTFLTKINS